MAEQNDSKSLPNYDIQQENGEENVKIICLGDSAVGKSKLIERFLMDGYQPQQLSTYALTLFKYKTKVRDKTVHVDFWDTAGQERFSSMHPSYYHQAHACILVFDGTRKVTYKNLDKWFEELREHRPEIPCLCACNKIDVDMNITTKSFNFPRKHGMPFYYVSAADGTNVVKNVVINVNIQVDTERELLLSYLINADEYCCFRDAISAAIGYKTNTTDFMDEIMKELENFDLSNVTVSDDADISTVPTS